MMYQCGTEGDHTARSIPFRYIEGCVIGNDNQTITIHFRERFWGVIGTKRNPIEKWMIKLEDPHQVTGTGTSQSDAGCSPYLQVRPFVQNLTQRVVQKDDGAFILGFEDGASEFEVL